LTPSEESVLRSIRELPEQLRTKGFKRRDLKVREVSDRRVKEVLKSLTDTGYLDYDGRQGPQGYTYTLAREAEKISLGISLRPPPDKDELRIDEPNTNGRKRLARYRSSPNGGEDCETYQEAGESSRNDHRPIETAELKGKCATGRAGGGKREENFTANGSSGRRFTAEEERRVRKLLKEGMSETWARRTVLASDHLPGCDCEVCL
jgi:hypothetical protein